MGGFAMIFACARCYAPEHFLLVSFFLQVKHLQRLSRARQPTIYDESLRWQHFRPKRWFQDMRVLYNRFPPNLPEAIYSRDEAEDLSLSISTSPVPSKTLG